MSPLGKARFRAATCASLIALVTSTTAMAQDVPASDDAAEAEAIVVTGSRIARPDLESTVPVAILSNDAILKQGNNNLGDTLNDLPQLRSSFSQQNPGLGVGIAGLNLLDLRGLGTQRTLVLVNGRRHVAADVLNNGVSVDVNTIPSDLIERVDIVTGGNSAIYGSDAIAGVVNFILKKDYDGLQLTGKAGISTPGAYGANQQLSAIAGKNFADGRGNVTLAFEYSNQERVYTSDIPFLKRVDGLIVNDIDPAGTPNGSDGNPDRIFVNDIRQANINRFGLVPITQRAGSAACGTGVNGVPFNCTYIFQPDGTLVAQTGTRYGSGVIGGIVGGNGQTGREDQLISVLPKQQRYNANLLAHYEFTPAFDVFFEGKYSQIKTVGGNAGPASIQGQFTQFDYRERVRLDNPFLSASARQTIAAALLASGCNPSLSAACTTTTDSVRNSQGPLTAAQIAQINAGTYRFAISRNLADLGNRDEFFNRKTYRAVLGARGSFWDTWRYEVSANYGRTEEHTEAKGYLDRQRFGLAMDAGRNPVTGAIQCRSQFDPASAVAYTTSPTSAASAFNQARLAADIAACVPYNPFGAANNAASAAYFMRDYVNDSFAEQLVFSAFVSGDLGQNLKLWGGPVRFALGVEHREEDTGYAQDDFAASGNSTAVAFGEIQIPIFEDRPFFHELTLSGAARVAKYQGAVGTVWAWNGGVDWAPISDIRFRANYSRSVRAPNPAETFGELIPNFAPGFTDPCTTANIGAGTQFRGANCATALGGNLSNIASLGAYSLPILSGVNPNLKAEKSNSLTLGAVFRPRFIPGLTVAVDYYSIKVDGVIVSLTAQQIANSCYDQPTLDNAFCGLFQRFAGPGAGPQSEVAGQILGNTLISAPFNFAKRVRRGIDTQINYSTDLGGDWKMSASAIYTHNFQNSNYENPAIPDFENRRLSELGDPKDEFRVNADVTFRRFTLGYQLQYISPMYVNNFENYNPLQGRPPQDADYSAIPMYPAVWYHDVRFEYKLDRDNRGNQFSFFGGVDNLFNEIPPLGQTATGERIASGGDGGNIYSIRGRQFYVGFKANF
ncbi:TonB-dependent receptor domain-containing protein [Novosphingobium sp. JCM 18896]|uniref:TonB-dependent receptor domain-containing protein n=1 Tax=Novosphingobium sp. JCM 18896 TaxID=2989731 RepID=UPI0022224E90|nr:TonB-dependent receptor [Novosphingobium sp. JCM 18896]MCW1429651.1 TonB-dependent receptor [Novosphingobium sp. JCM 18896]